MASPNVTVPEELLVQAQAEATAEGKTVDELTAEALKKHIAQRTLARLRRQAEAEARHWKSRSRVSLLAPSGSTARIARPVITVDTNIYISAFKFGRKPMELLEMGRRAEKLRSQCHGRSSIRRCGCCATSSRSQGNGWTKRGGDRKLLDHRDADNEARRHSRR